YEVGHLPGIGVVRILKRVHQFPADFGEGWQRDFSAQGHLPHLFGQGAFDVVVQGNAHKLLLIEISLRTDSRRTLGSRGTRSASSVRLVVVSTAFRMPSSCKVRNIGSFLAR